MLFAKMSKKHDKTASMRVEPACLRVVRMLIPLFPAGRQGGLSWVSVSGRGEESLLIYFQYFNDFCLLYPP